MNKHLKEVLSGALHGGVSGTVSGLVLGKLDPKFEYDLLPTEAGVGALGGIVSQLEGLPNPVLAGALGGGIVAGEHLLFEHPDSGLLLNRTTGGRIGKPTCTNTIDNY